MAPYRVYNYGNHQLLSDIPLLGAEPGKGDTCKSKIHIKMALGGRNDHIETLLWSDRFGAFGVYKSYFGYTIRFPSLASFSL